MISPSINRALEFVPGRSLPGTTPGSAAHRVAAGRLNLRGFAGNDMND